MKFDDKAAAERWVDTHHVLASQYADPAAYLRTKQAEAEAEYAERGDSRSLAIVRAFEASLDRTQEES